MKISRKIFAITFLISSIAIAGMATLTLARTNATLHDLARQRLQESVSREARIISTLFDVVKSDLRMLAEQAGRGIDPRSGAGQAEVTEAVAMLMRKQPAYVTAEVRVAGPDGRVLAFEQADLGVRPVPTANLNAGSLRELARGLWPGNVHFSQLIERNGPDAYRPRIRVIQAATAIAPREDGRGGGLFVVAIDFDALITGFGRPRNDIAFFLGDRDGRYIYRPSVLQGEGDVARSNDLVAEFGLGERWRRWLGGGDPQLRFDDAGRKLSVAVERVLLADPLAEDGTQVIAVGGMASLADIEAEIRAYRTQLVGAALGVGALVALALALATNHLTRPIQDLTQVADRIAAGERNLTSASVGRRDEFGVLARAIMRMLDALRDSAKNEEQAAMGRMATMIAHDVRNALSSVKMNVKILHTHHTRGQDKLAEGCEIALEQIGYMENILTDMLDFARPNGLVMDWVDLDEAIRIATLSMLPDISEKSIVLCQSHERLPKVFGDRTRLIQVFQNLMANAIQAMGEGGHLSIDASSTLHRSRPAVEVAITDNGPGISEDVLAKVFEPFFTTRTKGTGLGLTIVRRIVVDHGGDIRLEAGAEGGTVARVILPLSPADWEDEQ
ncbi:ATP-binding protein [Magnetospirillum sp. UT-4]|uniref:sensor histidine kinase n=1 Tax=Magnetospirillum sp. UT-4 TaxID=2681467 RepID=UPI001383DDF7|nr:ATP-binding protein [Magnetospirillum sp. UT-4]CAA7620490.1 putative ATP-binding region, ATPase-like:Histidine kinase, HAMP region:Histidine kinase A, N-terminal [Magnetospirillum sp. UT-4]